MNAAMHATTARQATAYVTYWVFFPRLFAVGHVIFVCVIVFEYFCIFGRKKLKVCVDFNDD